MRILYYSYPYFLDHVLPQIQALSKYAEVDVIIELAPENWNSSIFDLPCKKLKSGLYSASQIFGNDYPESVKDYWKNCKSFNFYVFDNRRSLYPTTWKQAWILNNILRNLGVDVIHFDGVSLRMAPFLWHLKKYPIVLNVHDAEPHTGENNWRRRLTALLARKSADHFIFHSKFSKNEFISKYGMQTRQASMIQLGVLDIFQRWNSSIEKEENNNVLFFGRLSPYKGLENFIEASSIVAQEIRNCKFVIAGRPIPDYRIPLLPELSNGSIFILRDEYITNRELCRFMEHASIVTCPYTDASQSGVVLTAYAFNKPIVATNVGGLQEYVKNGSTGIIIPPNNSGALADAIITLLSNANLRNKMSETINKTKNKLLNWNNSALEMMNIYKKLVSIKNCK